MELEIGMVIKRRIVALGQHLRLRKMLRVILHWREAGGPQRPECQAQECAKCDAPHDSLICLCLIQWITELTLQNACAIACASTPAVRK
jgi:hypothetical protein